MTKYELYTWKHTDDSPHMLVFSEEPKPLPNTLWHYEVYRIDIDEHGHITSTRLVSEWSQES